MKRKPIIIGIGELLWDVLPTGKKAGGAPINFAYHASRLGVKSYAISAVGNDLLGIEIIQEIKKAGVNFLIEYVDYPTGTVIVNLRDGIPNYNIVEGVAWDHIPLKEEMKELARKTDVICFGTLAQRSQKSRETIQTILSVVPHDSFKILDINIRQHYYSKEIITSSLKSCNVLKMNIDELTLLKKVFKIETLNNNNACLWFIERYHLKYLILTAGEEYSIIYTYNKLTSYIATPRVNVIDTVGAGDAFTGAFITSILDGKSLIDAHKAAVERAAFVCTRPGAWVSK